MRIHVAVTLLGSVMLAEPTFGQQLSFKEAKVHGRQAYVLENGRMRVSALQGGGHLAEIRLQSSDPQKSINPHAGSPLSYDRAVAVRAGQT